MDQISNLINSFSPHSSDSEDFWYLLQSCKNFYREAGFGEVNSAEGPDAFSEAKLWRVPSEMDDVLTKNFGTTSPSLFKRCAAFTIAFMKVSPLKLPLNGAIIPELSNLANHQNAIFAFEYCRAALFNARVFKNENGQTEEAVLENRISVSKHFYVDTIHAFTKLSDSATCYIVPLLYESLVYKTNPNCPYIENF